MLQRVAAGSWFDLPELERAERSPEMHAVEWMDLIDVVRAMQSSIGETVHPVNSWQAAQFAEHAIIRRDPMSVTMAILLDIEFRAAAITSPAAAVAAGPHAVGGSSGGGSHSTDINNSGSGSSIVHPNAAAIEAEVATMIAAESDRFSRNVFNLTVEGGSTNAAANAAAWHATKPKL